MGARTASEATKENVAAFSPSQGCEVSASGGEQSGETRGSRRCCAVDKGECTKRALVDPLDGATGAGGWQLDRVVGHAGHVGAGDPRLTRYRGNHQYSYAVTTPTTTPID